jgi:ankyrin repeat protein
MFTQKDYKNDSYYQNLSDLDKLNYAIEEFDIPTIKNLLEHIDVNSLDDTGHTPLYNAIADGNLQVIKLLVASGADINIRDDNGLTPLYEVCSSLIESIGMLCADQMGSELIENCALSYISIAQFLIDSGANTTLKYNTQEILNHSSSSDNTDKTLVSMITETEFIFHNELTHNKNINENEKIAIKAVLKHLDTLKKMLQNS